jgi:hypothetical protein
MLPAYPSLGSISRQGSLLRNTLPGTLAGIRAIAWRQLGLRKGEGARKESATVRLTRGRDQLLAELGRVGRGIAEKKVVDRGCPPSVVEQAYPEITGDAAQPAARPRRRGFIGPQGKRRAPEQHRKTPTRRTVSKGLGEQKLNNVEIASETTILGRLALDRVGKRSHARTGRALPAAPARE